MDKIIIKKARFLGNIGVTAEERKEKQELIVDVLLSTEKRLAAETDAIEKTINYAQVYKCMTMVIAQREYNLIETVAEELAKALSQHFNFKEITLCVKKPMALRLAEYAAVEIKRKYG